METSHQDWLRCAATMPVAFAQVREDALLDRWVLEQTPRGAAVAMVASGGCTAALLASCGHAGRMTLVDPNPAQLALAQLKLGLLAEEPPERLRLLGHQAIDPATRAERLSGVCRRLGVQVDALGPADVTARLGPDHAGRYELLFAALREALHDMVGPLDDLLQLSDPREQAGRAAASTELGRRLDEALAEVMALPNLVCLFGQDATNNRVEPFASHFARRTRHALATLPARDNPYLWQMLRGKFPASVVSPWLELPAVEPAAEIQFVAASMNVALTEAVEQYDLVHLSNILDWLSEQDARRTLELARRALKPGGWTLIRQLNSTLDIPKLSAAFHWLPDEAAALHARDRSFFYRRLHLGRKR